MYVRASEAKLRQMPPKYENEIPRQSKTDTRTQENVPDNQTRCRAQSQKSPRTGMIHYLAKGLSPFKTLR